MDETNVPEQDPWVEIAAELHRIADDAAKLVGQPVAPHFELNIQPWSADDYRGVTVKNRAATIASVDAVALALLGKPARTDKLSDGTFFHKVGGRRGRVSFSIYQSVADPALIDKDEEIAQLRARLAELQGDGDKGLAYSRPADGDEPQPVAGREPMHTGGLTEQGLVDETPEQSASIVDTNLRAMGSEGLVGETPQVSFADRLAAVLPDGDPLDDPGPCWHGDILPGRPCPGSGPDCGPA